jgi:colanic acid/amylovoran biosynthesis glycosyltransferase
MSRRPLHLLEVGVRWLPETFLRWKLEGLAARGMRVTLASRSIVDPEERLPGIELVALPQAGARPAPARVWLKAVASFAIAPRRMTRLLREIRRLPADQRRRRGGVTGLLGPYLPLLRLRPDVVHFEWHSVAALYVPMFAVWRCPVVTSSHGSDFSVYPFVPGDQHATSLLPAVFERAAAVHCVSESLRRAAIGLGLDPAKARVIRQGVDPRIFRPGSGGRPRDRGTLRVISIAGLRWMKGFEWALVAVRALLDAGVPVRLDVLGGDPAADAGEPGERERIVHTVADLGLEEHVRLLPSVPSAEVVNHLHGSDVLLVPSLDEGLPTVLLEAMACGVPVVATDCGGVSEALSHDVEGLLVPPRDAEALAAALERLWRDPELRARMGEAGRRTATSRFTLERQLEEFMALYREVADA